MFTTLLLLSTLGCDNGIKALGGTGLATDPTHNTTGSGSGTGSGTGNATGTGTSSSTGDTAEPLDCQADYTSLMPPGGGTCLVGQLQCGDVLFGTNEGGTTIYDYNYWEGAFALGSLVFESNDVLDGPERVYGFVGHTSDFNLTITVESCGMIWGGWRAKGDIADDWCAPDQFWDTAGHFNGSSTNQSYTFVNSTQGVSNYEIILDSYLAAEGNYMVTVDCF